MKNKILQSLGISLILVLLTTGIALASDSISVAVSATIPAVPGLNAPPFEEANKNSAAMAASQIQEITQKDSTLQTVYNR